MIQIIKALGIARMMRTSYRSQARNPIIFVPGLYGSMGDEIIPGTGDWTFGISVSVYKPFIEKLEAMGYVQGENLFIAYYDWRKECKFCMENYLLPKIKEAKKKSKSRKVDIICHSMGGLVSRAYVQSRYYKYDVENLIFIATPHYGAANAYSFWTEGKFLSQKDAESQILTILLEGYLWILTRLQNYKSELETIHNLLLGALDLLPNRDYGKYLYYFDKEKKMHYLPYEGSNFENSFLDELNYGKELIKARRIKTTLIVGKGIETNEKFQLSNPDSKVEKIVSIVKTSDGDGTVTLKSATAIEGDTYVINGANHTSILEKCFFIIKNKLGLSDEDISKKDIVDSIAIQKEKMVSILLKGSGSVKLYMKTDEGTKLLYDGDNKLQYVHVEEYSPTLKWIVLHNSQGKELLLEYEASEADSMDIQIKSTSGKKIKFKELQPVMGHKYKIKI